MKTKHILFLLLLFVVWQPVQAQKYKSQRSWVLDHIELGGNPWLGQPEGAWSVSQNQASSPYVSFAWQDPPSKIDLGEEGKIVIPFTEQIWETDINYGFWGSIWIPRLERGINLWGGEDGRLSSYSSVSEFETLDLVSGEVLTINIWPFYLDDELNKCCKSISYVYSLVGDVKEVITPPTPPIEPSNGIEIPWTFIVVGGLIAGGAAVVIRKKGKKKSKSAPKQQEKPQHSTYRMILYKDFGDTLIFGDVPRTISARIEEITPKGNVIERADLTSKIQITAEQDCAVGNLRMQGKYQSADVIATKEPAENTLGEARVRMVFIGPGGALINHVVFKVVERPKPSWN